MPKKYGSPNMSDTALLVSVEDLINMAMGPPDVNVVNFKMIQTVLHILARQLRMLETQVEIRIGEAPPPREKKEKKKQPEPPSTDSSSSKSPRKVSPPPKSPMKEIKEEKTKLFQDRDKERAEKAALKEKEREAKMTVKEREKAEKERERAARADEKDREKVGKAALKDRDKASRAESKERDKAERAQSKERDRGERAESKERDKAERAASKDREKAERAESKERDKAGRAESKEREKAERAESKEREKAEKGALKDKEKMEKMDAKDRERAEKEQAKLEKMSAKDREKLEKMDAKHKEKAEKEKEKMAKMDAKEREKYEKEQEKLAKMDAKDKEKAEKEKEKMAKMDAKEREKYEKEQEKLAKMDAKDKEKAEKEKEKMAKMDAKEREKYEKEQEKLAKMDAKDREKAEKEQEKLAKMDAKDKEKAEKEKEKMAKMDAKEREKYEKEQEKLAKMDAKDREKAEKEQEKLAKMDAKDRERAEREQEKLAKMDAKDREKAEKEKEKMDAKEREKYENEQEKLAKMDAKDREKAEKEKEKADKAAAKEKEKLDKMSAKEREKYEKERAKSAKAGISIKEKDKVLIVEKGPTTRSDSHTRVGSIEVVTVSQFELLEAAVRDLKNKAGPLPFPALPDNQKLRTELARGSASLTDTMQAMQVAARVQAAETAIGRMAGLLTQLAAAGALPKDVAGKLEDVKAEMDAITEESAKTRTPLPRKSVAIDPMSKKGSTTSRVEAKQSGVGVRPSVISGGSGMSKVSIGVPGVSHMELDDAIRSLKDDLTRNVNNLTTKATVAAESASAMAKSVSDKLDIALKLNTRINSLYSLVTDYAEQLSGFDAGLTTQMQSFQEQMAQMRNDLKGGVALLETANNNAETAAVMELTERYDGLVVELDQTLHAHQGLTAFQKQLADELHSLLECVETLREQKADRDEVQDGLRDKADNSRLAGLLTEVDFASSRLELERRLDLCYDKFRKQEQVWMGAIKDLTAISEGKAEIMQLLAARDDAQQQLRDIQDKLLKLAIILGEPKAAMLTRQLSKGARCGACQVPALQEPMDISYGKPPLLPAVRPPPAGEEKPCLPEWRPQQPPDDREHTCHRWVGGSHTLLAESVVKEQAGPLQTFGPPTKRYAGYGSDGRLYMMEEELQPCVECNMISEETGKIVEDAPKEPGGNVQADGAGDTGINTTTMELPL